MKKIFVLAILALSFGASASSSDLDLSSAKNSVLVGFKMSTDAFGGTLEFQKGNRFLQKSSIPGNTNYCTGKYSLSKYNLKDGHIMKAGPGNIFIAIYNIKCTGEVLRRESYWSPTSVAEYEECPHLDEVREHISLNVITPAVMYDLTPFMVSGDSVGRTFSH